MTTERPPETILENPPEPQEKKGFIKELSDNITSFVISVRSRGLTGARTKSTGQETPAEEQQKIEPIRSIGDD